MRFGILFRYILGQVLRAFLMGLATMTLIIVLFMVMAEASRMGLTPSDIVRLVPYTIPTFLPYTVPVALLFAVSVVYGRLAGDNEVIAVKAAGLGAWTVLWPALLLGGVLSLALTVTSAEAIPSSTHQAKLSVARDFEDMFYKLLKKNREFNSPGLDFVVRCEDVQDRVLIRPTFWHRAKGKKNLYEFDTQVKARRAIIRFDTKEHVARITLYGAEMQSDNGQWVQHTARHEEKYPIDERVGSFVEKSIQEYTTPELEAEQARFLREIRQVRRVQVARVALAVAAGHLRGVRWGDLKEAEKDYQYYRQKYSEYETEKQLRTAMAWGPLFFALLGAPVGILFARRDFLSAFISCFLPIIGLYYPLVLAFTNLGRMGTVSPILGLWTGNALLGLLAGFFALPPVRRH